MFKSAVDYPLIVKILHISPKAMTKMIVPQMIFGLFWLNMNLVKGSRELFFTSSESIKKWYWFNRTNWTTFEIISNFHNRVYRKETDSLISWQKNSITKWSGWKIAIAFWDHLKSWRKNKNWRNYEFNEYLQEIGRNTIQCFICQFILVMHLSVLC
jgi:hypothetical protein